MELKKVFAVLATGALAASLMAGCSSNNSTTPANNNNSSSTQDTASLKTIKPEQGAKLLVWYDGDGDKAWATQVAKDFTAKYGVPVKLASVGATDAPGKIEKDGPAGLGADVFVSPHDHVGQFVAAGDVMQNMDADYYKKVDMPAAITGLSANNDQGEITLYGYPMSIETYALYYNKDLLKKEGLEVPKTWDELFADAKKFNDDASVQGKHYGFMMDVGNYYFMHSFLAGYGGYVFGKDGTDPKDLGLSGDPAQKTADFVKKMHDVLPMKQASITADVMSSLFNTNKLMFTVSGPWDIKNHTDAKVNFGVAPMPKLDNGKVPQTFSGVKGMFVSAYTKYPKAATLYAEFATNDKNLTSRFKSDQQLPVATALLDSSEIKSNPIYSAFLEQATHSTPMPNIPQMQSVWAPMGTAFVSTWDNNSGKTAFDKAVNVIKESIKTQSK